MIYKDKDYLIEYYEVGDSKTQLALSYNENQNIVYSCDALGVYYEDLKTSNIQIARANVVKDIRKRLNVLSKDIIEIIGDISEQWSSDKIDEKLFKLKNEVPNELFNK